jgi:hypothetical protein
MRRAIGAIAVACVVGCGGDVVTTTGAGGGDATSTASSGTTSAQGGATTTGQGGATSTTTGQGGATCGDCQGFDCCPTGCTNLQNDVHHCGTCDDDCTAGQPPDSVAYCDHGTCGVPPCGGTTVCNDPGETCCGTTCCAGGELCCSVPGPIGETLGCFAPVDGTCPKGCVLCECASEGTMIATPEGDRPIESLVPGDLVYTEVDDTLTPVPLALVSKKPVREHVMVRAHLANGRDLVMSAGHPLGDGRKLGDVHEGDLIDGVRVERVTVEAYDRSHTYDLLPARGSGRYVANGVFVGTTLR